MFFNFISNTDFQNKMVNFIPLNGQGKKETVNEYDNDTETSKNVAIQYQICFTEESGKSWYIYIKRMF